MTPAEIMNSLEQGEKKYLKRKPKIEKVPIEPAVYICSNTWDSDDPDPDWETRTALLANVRDKILHGYTNEWAAAAQTCPSWMQIWRNGKEVPKLI